MGRLTNAKGLRPLNKNSKGLIRGVWFNNMQKSNEYIEVSNCLDSVTSYKHSKDLGVLLVDRDISDTSRGLVISLYLYTAFVDNLLSQVGSPVKEEINSTASIRPYYIKALVLEKIYLAALKGFSENKHKRQVMFNFHFSSNNFISARLISYYIKSKFKQKFLLGEVIYPLLRFLKSHPKLYGYRIDLSGRISRRQRASRSTFKDGSVPFSNIGATIDYYDDFFVSKYGKCGIKVWLHKEEALQNEPTTLSFKNFVGLGSN